MNGAGYLDVVAAGEADEAPEADFARLLDEATGEPVAPVAGAGDAPPHAATHDNRLINIYTLINLLRG